jgi:PAS domain S-box-containing protein
MSPTMTDTVFDELKRYIGFSAADEASLRRFRPAVEAHFDRIVDAFYEQVREHPPAARVFDDPEQVARHKVSLRDWLQGLFEGPWDVEYFERRRRIGRVHVQIELPQRYMFGAMNLIRIALTEVADREWQAPERTQAQRAIHKLLDLELAIMLESYREAYVDRIQREERVERDELRRQLALSEARYEEVVEKAEALITTLDQDGRVLLFNGKSERVTGISRNQARGASWLELFVPREDRDLVRGRHAQALSGQFGVSYEGTPPVITAGACRVRWQFATVPDGGKPALCAIGIDVSNEHELGIRTRRAERMAALGTMAAGLAHEIRNPLNAARLQLNLAERRLQRGDGDAEATTSAVRTAASEMERLGELVNDFLRFAEPQALSLQRVDLRPTLRSSVATLAAEAQSRGVALELTPGEDVAAEADREKIQQLLLNLVRNAIEATGRGGHVDVSVAARGPYAEIVVHDDGPGLATGSPVFAPFYTTKEHGTGLGLAIVHRIAMDHGGQVAVQSIPGDTRFTVSLPRSQTS